MDVFTEIPCLIERSGSLSGLSLRKKWFRRADKRTLGETLQKFISYNRELFSFLEVEPTIEGTDQSVSLVFRTSRFIGAIPLRAPDTGKQIGDFVVAPRFIGRDRFRDYVEILDLLGTSISPEFADSLPLASGRNFRPPFYLEAVKFITAVENLVRTPWIKFANIEVDVNSPSGQVNWSKYTEREYKVENHLRFPVRRNVLNELHSEYSEIRYVFDICRDELLSSNTPQKLRGAIRPRLSFIETKLYHHKPKVTNQIAVRAADSRAIKICKEQANIVLGRNFVNSTAWRVDFNDVFEKFVQHIFKELAKITGGRLYPNPSFASRTASRYSWELGHIEPDAVFRNDDITVFIDAKYKSHLFNKYDDSEFLKSEHRHDLHQILAYSSFTKSGRKIGALCYPSSVIETKVTSFWNRIDDSSNTVIMVGIPLSREIIPQAVRELTRQFERLRQEVKA